MSKKILTIDDLIAAMKNPNIVDDEMKAELSSLANTADTWARIGARDVTLAGEIGIEESELNDFLKEWIEDNPYRNI